MTSERIKEIQETTAYPNSVSVKQALLQVWNECAQEQSRQAAVTPALPSVEQIKRTLYECAKIENTGDGVKVERLFEKEAEALLNLFSGNAG